MQIKSEKLTVTEFTIDTYDAVLAIWQACPGVGLSEADSRANIKIYLDRNPGMSFIATWDKRLVGAVLAGHDGRRGYIHHLAVHPDYRRQGVGRRLVAQCAEALQGAGILKCHLFIFNDNAAGRAFWTAAGWQCREDIGVISKHLP